MARVRFPDGANQEKFEISNFQSPSLCWWSWPMMTMLVADDDGGADDVVVEHEHDWLSL